MFLSRNLLPQVRADTTRTGAITRVDAFGLFGASGQLQAAGVGFENTGESDYDALNLQLERRYANRWSGTRLLLAVEVARHGHRPGRPQHRSVPDRSAPRRQRRGPTPVDRRHVLSVAGRIEVPKTFGMTLAATVRYMTGSPFTIYNSNIDVDQNGQLDDPVPAGSYSGIGEGERSEGRRVRRAGATAPTAPTTSSSTCGLDGGSASRSARSRLFVDVFNLTNQTNFDNPIGGGLRPADAGHLPDPDQPARRQRLPALGAVRHAVRLLSRAERRPRSPWPEIGYTPRCPAGDGRASRHASVPPATSRSGYEG